MKKPSQKDMQTVLERMCDLSQNFYGVDVFTSKDIMRRTSLTRYKVLQVLNHLRETGIVERASMGCPAQMSYGEITEMICEAAPPVNGWRLTSKGRETDAYKAAVKEFNNSLAEWANGDKDGESDG